MERDLTQKYVTATDLASYYLLNCKLSLRKNYQDYETRRGAGRSDRSTPLSTARISRGEEFERSLVQRLEAENLILRVTEEEDFVAGVESDQRTHFYVVGAAFRDGGLFREEYRSRGTDPVGFGTFKPDFIEMWKKNAEDGKPVIEYRIIDAKSSRRMKVHFPS
jgi:hypothetical protein